MGLFDEIRCNYPLPIELPDWVEYFQTKGLVRTMSRFEITTDGRLAQLTGGFTEEIDDWSDYHGEIGIYTDNVRAADGLQWYTENGEPAHFIKICIRFTDGRVSRVRVDQNEQVPARPRSESRIYKLIHDTMPSHIKKERS